jgi:sugar/nucleoside kinase (ribokinase family)
MGCSLMANDGSRARIIQAVASLHDQGARISFDPNIRPELLGDKSLEQVIGPVLDRCSVLFPGTAELELLSGKQGVEGGVGHVFDTHPLEIVVVKHSRAGSTVYTRSGVVDVAPYRTQEVDPTGAGDCYNGAFLCGLLEGQPLNECGQMASAAGALKAAAFDPMEG